MKKFRENAQVLHNAAAKRKIAANLVKKESSTQLRIFNTLFTAQESSDEEDKIEIIQKKREKEKKLESVIQARLEQKEAEEKEREEEATKEEENDKFENEKSDLFEYLSPISSTEDDCEKESIHQKLRKIILHRVHCDVKDLPPWIIAEPLATGDNKPKTKDVCLQTEYIPAQKITTSANTEPIEIKDSETQYEIESTTSKDLFDEKSAFEIIMEELSEEIYLDQLLAIRKHDSSIKQSIVLNSESLKNSEIVDFVYLKAHDSFFLLLKNQQLIGIEKWSFKNLIKPDFVMLSGDSDNDGLLKMEANNDVTLVLSGTKVFCISNSQMILMFETKITDFEPSSITLTNNNRYIVASSENFYVYSLNDSTKLKRIIPKSKITDSIKEIYCNGSYLFAITDTWLSVYEIETGIHVNSKQISEKVLNQNKGKKFLIMENGNILVFIGNLNKAVIFNPKKFAEFSTFEYEFTFTSSENLPISFTIFQNDAFSIDSKGDISKWDLLKNHRKVRSKILSSNNETSKNFQALGTNIFAISTSNKLFGLILPN